MTEKRSQSDTYSAIDVAKFLMALCVVAIHTSVVKEPAVLKYSTELDIFFRMAVPFFFMSSSFFLFSKIKNLSVRERNEIINQYICKMIRLYILWTVIYFPIAVYGYVSQNTPLYVVILSVIRGFFLYGENYMSWQLWYLLCTIYSVVVIKVLINHNWKDFQILVLSSLVFSCSMIIRYFTDTVENYSGIFRYAVRAVELIFADGRILTGMFYLSVGMCIANWPKLHNIPWYGYLASAILSFWVTVCRENEITKQILYVSFFLFTLTVPVPGKTGFLGIRRASTIIYFVHMIFVFVLSLVPRMGMYYLMKFAVVTVTSLVVSWIVIWMENRKNKKMICFE